MYRSVSGIALFLIIQVFQLLPGIMVMPRVQAQDSDSLVTLSGKVMSRDSRPLPGATLFISELDRGTATDTNGRFLLEKLQTGTYQLEIRYIGYHKIDTLITLDRSKEVVFTLSVNAALMDELFVTAGRDTLAASVKSTTVLTKDELDRNRGQTLGDMLEKIPGVTTMTTGPAVSKPVIRGLHSQRIALINHGVTQEGQQWGSDHAPEIDPFSPDRLEVIRGASGVEYGPGAIGGVVRVDTDPIQKNVPIKGMLSLNGYTNNNQGAGSLRLEGGTGAQNNLGWRIQSSYRNAGDSQSPDDVIRNSGFRERNFNMTLNYEQSRLRHDLYFSHFETELGIFRGAHIGNVTDLKRAIELGRPTVDFEASRSIDNPRQEINHDLLRYKGRYNWENIGQLELQVGWQENRRKEFDLHRNFGSQAGLNDRAAFDLELTTWTADLKFRHEPTELGFWGTTGITSMKQANVRQTSGSLIPNFSSWTAGAFALEHWSNDRINAEVGIRVDLHQRQVFTVEDRIVREHNFSYASPSFAGGLTYTFKPDWSVSGNISTAWRPPGVNEQFSDGVHHGTAQFEQGNINLDPERSFSTDITLRHKSPATFFEVSVFNNIIDNYIFLQPGDEPVLSIRGSFPFFSYEQTKARISGFELLSEHRLTRRLQLGSSVSVLRGWNRTQNRPLIFMPSDRFQLTAHYDFLRGIAPLNNSYIEVSGMLVRRQTHFPQGIDFAPPPEGYRLLDIETGGDFRWGERNITFNLTISNLLNSSYRDYLSRFRFFVDDPGRNIIMRIQIPL